MNYVVCMLSSFRWVFTIAFRMYGLTQKAKALTVSVMCFMFTMMYA